jgi:hypothetical protein
MIEENNLMKEFEKYGLTVDDIQFIKQLILGHKDGIYGLFLFNSMSCNINLS